MCHRCQCCHKENCYPVEAWQGHNSRWGSHYHQDPQHFQKLQHGFPCGQRVWGGSVWSGWQEMHGEQFRLRKGFNTLLWMYAYCFAIFIHLVSQYMVQLHYNSKCEQMWYYHISYGCKTQCEFKPLGGIPPDCNEHMVWQDAAILYKTLTYLLTKFSHPCQEWKNRTDLLNKYRCVRFCRKRTGVLRYKRNE